MLSPDLNQVAAEVAKDLLKGFAGSFFDRAKTLTTDQINKLKAALRIGFEEYIQQTVERTAKVKTLLYRDESTPITNLYVDTNFEIQNQDVSEAEFHRRLSKNKRAIVAGNAGCGKSIFMKHCAFDIALRSQNKRIPIFVELRHINHHSTSIMHFALEQILKPTISNFDHTAFDNSLKSGLFVLLLDGFDEVNYDRRENYLQELMYMVERYPELEIVLSTRPEEATLALDGFDGFDVFHVKPLPKSLSLKLISQLEYDQELKDAFLIALRDRIYDEHKEFAANPLLLTMLLITFDQIRDSRQKMHIFFNQAFEALFFKHDRLKSLYQRKTYSNVDIEEIKRVYSWFCAVTYFEKEYSFNEARVDDLIKDAIKFYNVSAKPADIKSDLIYSYSMLKRDGLYVTFVHRAFQEYFCAVFLSRTEETDLFKAIDSLAARGRSEQPIRMLFDMAPERLMLRWMLPFLQEVKNQLDRITQRGSIVEFINLFYEGLSVSPHGELRLGLKKSNLEKLVMCGEMLLPDLGAVSILFLEWVKKNTHDLQKQEIEKFFGGNAPFQGKTIEPRGEDDGWLRLSSVGNLIEYTSKFVAGAVKHLETLAETRKIKSALFEKEAITRAPRSYTEGFAARGTKISEPREIRRNVIESSE